MAAYGVNCTEIGPGCTVNETVYGYYPDLGANVFFTAYFGTAIGLNAVLGIWFQTYTYGALMCISGIVEVVGYVGRIMLHSNPFSDSGFIMQICCIIIAPAFNTAAMYITVKYLTQIFGPEWSRVKPHLYTWIFITGDLISLILQAAGGGLASSANTQEELDNGNDIMLAGVCWQIFTLGAFALVVGDYSWRRMRAGVAMTTEARKLFYDIRFQVFAVATAFAWLFIFIRCIYRVVDFAGGWGNTIMKNEEDFIVLEGVMICIAFACQTIPHPGFCFPALRYHKGAKTNWAFWKKQPLAPAKTIDDDYQEAPNTYPLPERRSSQPDRGYSSSGETVV